MWKRRKSESMMADTRVPGPIKWLLLPMYPEVEENVVDYIKYSGSQSLPAAINHVKSCALRDSTELGMQTFKVSSNRIQNILNRSAMNSPFKHYGKGSTDIPASARESMVKIRETIAFYDLENVYSIDESGLLF